MFKTTVRVPGSCGELAQGIIDDVNFLISCPIDMYSMITIKLNSNHKFIVDDNLEKSRIALQNTLDYYNRGDLGGVIEKESPLLIGQGMGSSTADMIGVIAGVMKVLNYDINLEVIKNIVLSIEPSDCTFLPGINIFDHKNGNLQEYIGEPPEIDLLIFSEPGEINTKKFNQQKELYKLKKSKESTVKKAVEYIKKGIRTGNRNLIGKGTTLSSIAHQNVLFKPSLNNIINLIDDLSGVYGVNIAHSGTLIGLLVNPKLCWHSLIDEIIKENPQLNFIIRATLISGGIQIINT